MNQETSECDFQEHGRCEWGCFGEDVNGAVLPRYLIVVFNIISAEHVEQGNACLQPYFFDLFTVGSPDVKTAVRFAGRIGMFVSLAVFSFFIALTVSVSSGRYIGEACAVNIADGEIKGIERTDAACFYFVR